MDLFGDRPKGRANIQSDVLVQKQRLEFSGTWDLGTLSVGLRGAGQRSNRLRFFGSLGLDLGTLGLGLRLNGGTRKVRANMQSDAVLVPKQRLGFSGALGTWGL